VLLAQPDRTLMAWENNGKVLVRVMPRRVAVLAHFDSGVFPLSMRNIPHCRRKEAIRTDETRL
jgi:hypothetical protein